MRGGASRAASNSVATIQSTILNDSPRMYLPLTADANDISGNNVNGTIVGGVTFANNRATFDGSTGYIHAHDLSPLLGAVPFTIECMVKMNAFDGVAWGATVFDGSAQLTHLRTNASNNLQIMSATFSNLLPLPSSTLDGNERHIVVTQDGNGQYTGYVDGVQAAQSTMPAALFQANARFTIGARLSFTGIAGNYVPAFFFAGTIRHVAAYDYLLPQSQISAHAAAIASYKTNPRPQIKSVWADADSTSVQVKARVSGGKSFRLGVSTTPGLNTPSYSTATTPTADSMVTMTVSGLTANTQYYYGIEVDGVLNP